MQRSKVEEDLLQLYNPSHRGIQNQSLFGRSPGLRLRRLSAFPLSQWHMNSQPFHSVWERKSFDSFPY